MLLLELFDGAVDERGREQQGVKYVFYFFSTVDPVLGRNGLDDEENVLFVYVDGEIVSETSLEDWPTQHEKEVEDRTYRMLLGCDDSSKCKCGCLDGNWASEQELMRQPDIAFREDPKRVIA